MKNKTQEVNNAKQKALEKLEEEAYAAAEAALLAAIAEAEEVSTGSGE